MEFLPDFRSKTFSNQWSHDNVPHPGGYFEGYRVKCGPAVNQSD